jgi:hypothetical protein
MNYYNENRVCNNPSRKLNYVPDYLFFQFMESMLLFAYIELT